MLSLVDKDPLMETNSQKSLNNNSHEAVELLGLSSSDSLDSPTFTHFQAPKQKRKVRFKKQHRPNSRTKISRNAPTRSCKCDIRSCIKIVAYLAAIAVIGGLFWHVMILSTRIQELQAKFSDIEAGSRNTPEALHVIHSSLKQIDSNVTLLYIEVKKNIADINNITEEVKLLKGVAGNLKESIAAAPAIQQLPKDILSLSGQIASFGSKLNAMESNVKELKDQQSNLQTTAQSLSGDLDTVKVSMQELANSTDAQAKSYAKDSRLLKKIQDSSESVEKIKTELRNIENSVDKMNVSVMGQLNLYNDLPQNIETHKKAIEYLSNDTLIKSKLIASLDNLIRSNLSLRLEQLESGQIMIQPSSADIQNFNKTVSEVLLQLINKGILHRETQNPGSDSIKSLEETHDILVLLAALLQNFEAIPANHILNDSDASVVVKNMLQKAFDEMIAPRDKVIQGVEQQVQNLTLICIPPSNSHGGDADISTASSIEGHSPQVQNPN